MNNQPVVPLIKIDKGACRGDDISTTAAIQILVRRLPKVAPMNPNDPLVPKIEYSEVGNKNRVTATINLVPLSSTYDTP